MNAHKDIYSMGGTQLCYTYIATWWVGEAYSKSSSESWSELQLLVAVDSSEEEWRRLGAFLTTLVTLARLQIAGAGVAGFAGVDLGLLQYVGETIGRLLLSDVISPSRRLLLSFLNPGIAVKLPGQILGNSSWFTPGRGEGCTVPSFNKTAGLAGGIVCERLLGGCSLIVGR